MFFISKNNHELYKNIEAIGLKHKINGNKILIKINMGRPNIMNHPQTDISLLKTIICYIYENGGKCAIVEGKNGFLKNNLIASGFEDTLIHYEVQIIDIDIEDYDEVVSFGEYHYIPKCFQEFPVRIAIPCATKRKDMLYSNNIKSFVGAVPRKMYQLDREDIANGAPRPRIHQNLHLSIANVFYAINSYSPFHFFINGGLFYNENLGELNLTETYIGDDALELDYKILQTYFSDCEYPEYLSIIKTRQSKNGI
jgi:hypothetical protein